MRGEERLLATIACHSAVQLGDKLSYEEMEALIKDWLSSRHPATCPHGRSIYYRMYHKYKARKFDWQSTKYTSKTERILLYLEKARSICLRSEVLIAIDRA